MVAAAGCRACLRPSPIAWPCPSAPLLAGGTLAAAALPSFWLLALWFVLGAGLLPGTDPAGRLLRRSAHPEDRPAVYAAQLALSHARWLVTYRSRDGRGRRSAFLLQQPPWPCWQARRSPSRWRCGLPTIRRNSNTVMTTSLPIIRILQRQDGAVMRTPSSSMTFIRPGRRKTDRTWRASSRPLGPFAAAFAASAAGGGSGRLAACRTFSRTLSMIVMSSGDR